MLPQIQLQPCIGQYEKIVRALIYNQLHEPNEKPFSYQPCFNGFLKMRLMGQNRFFSCPFGGNGGFAQNLNK
jgi:hypothetical protein